MEEYTPKLKEEEAFMMLIMLTNFLRRSSRIWATVLDNAMTPGGSTDDTGGPNRLITYTQCGGKSRVVHIKVVSEHSIMAPPPETRQTSRIEQVEEAVAALQRSMSEEVTAAVNRAAAEMQVALVAQITTSLDQVTQKLQVRIDRVRENNETLVEAVNKRHDDLQSEVRSTVTSLKLGLNQPSGYNHYPGSNHDVGKSATRGTEAGVMAFQTTSNTIGGDKAVEDQGGGTMGFSGGNWRYRKLELPVFDGSNPDGWILRAERFIMYAQCYNELSKFLAPRLYIGHRIIILEEVQFVHAAGLE
ncbi:hypothetical protein POM88_049949 [Heracleum sosnowskyi]|uniref:Uncharacterized protein n=1 Tax=Heracleum sosnowskyi TaxID=360622 RepID=A0AAD8GY09_9APIA|nr:hypothetical protein POM88_049949 [Heracleum sosnowskyi]